MSNLSNITKRLASAGLFSRLLLVMFATVIIAQAVTFALVVAMPTPLQPTTSIQTIAQSLRNGVSDVDELRVGVGAPPRDNMVDQREYLAALQLAAALEVPYTDVRVVQIRAGNTSTKQPAPPNDAGAGLFGFPPDRGPGRDVGEGPQTMPNDRAADVLSDPGEISGPFEAGLRLSDGRWRVATLQGPLVAAWQWEVLLWLVGSIIAVAPLAWLFARRIANPIAGFAFAARRIGTNPSVTPMDVTGPPEIAEAIFAINEMQRQILQFVDDRTMMIGAMAHDLRTPLMRLALRLERAPNDLREASQRDIEEIHEMTNAALAFTRDLAKPQTYRRIALRPLLETIVDDFADRAADVALVAGDEAIISGDPGGIKRMINNLVANAVVYGGKARVELDSAAQSVRIAVIDEGPGIPASEMDLVFNPFYRVEKSRNRNTGGTGLGLASARAVARSHGGDITLTNRAEGGVLALVMLPA